MFDKSFLSHLSLGWLCKMLRDNRCCDESSLRRQDCVQKVDDQAQSEGEDDSGDPNSQITAPQKHRRLSQFLR